MQTICDLKGVEFLRHCNKVRYAAQAMLRNTHVLDIRKRKAQLTGDETPEEKAEKINEQANKNISDMLDLLLEEKPEETYKFLRLLIITGDDEDEPSGMDILLIGMSVLSDERVVDFLLSLMKLGQMNTAKR